jgi:hypothetical protein
MLTWTLIFSRLVDRPRRASAAGFASRRVTPGGASLLLTEHSLKEAEVRNVLAVLVAVGLAAVSLAAQAPSAGNKAGTANSASTWKVPRTPDGHPDLQGVWANNSVTPTERPKQWKDKQSLTDAELQELKALVARYVSDGGDAVFQNFVQVALDAKDKGEYKQISYDRATGNYNEFWMAGRDWDNRTSLITDPPMA